MCKRFLDDFICENVVGKLDTNKHLPIPDFIKSINSKNTRKMDTKRLTETDRTEGSSDGFLP
jgi:hypothetical protein